jgi:hypothetical protein
MTPSSCCKSTLNLSPVFSNFRSGIGTSSSDRWTCLLSAFCSLAVGWWTGRLARAAGLLFDLDFLKSLHKAYTFRVATYGIVLRASPVDGLMVRD